MCGTAAWLLGVISRLRTLLASPPEADLRLHQLPLALLLLPLPRLALLLLRLTRLPLLLLQPVRPWRRRTGKLLKQLPRWGASPRTWLLPRPWPHRGHGQERHTRITRPRSLPRP